MRIAMIAAALLAVTGCGQSVTVPSDYTTATGSPSAQATWAYLHRNENCIAYPGVQPGTLIPKGTPVPAGATLVDISYCNPAE